VEQLLDAIVAHDIQVSSAENQDNWNVDVSVTCGVMIRRLTWIDMVSPN